MARAVCAIHPAQGIGSQSFATQKQTAIRYAKNLARRISLISPPPCFSARHASTFASDCGALARDELDWSRPYAAVRSSRKSF
jgi:hypothetical protein